MKYITPFFYFLFICIASFSQAPDIEWQNTIGGDGEDNLTSMAQTPDKGFIMGGTSGSNISGDKAEAIIGLYDFWVVKTDSLGNVEWENTIGGSTYDYLTKVECTSDGGYIIGGYSDSGISGDKTEVPYPGGYYGYDFWILKLDSAGNIEWQNTIGGNGDDYLKDIYQDSDGNYIIGGTSNSEISGDKSEGIMGEDDYWILKLDTIGNIIWQNTIGGNMSDVLNNYFPTSDAKYLLGGTSNSEVSFDKSEPSIESPFGGTTQDYWIVKAFSDDSIIWQNVIGGNSTDVLTDIRRTSDNGYIMNGYSSSSISSDKTETYIGAYDNWVVKINHEGEISWQNVIGTDLSEGAPRVLETYDTQYLVGCYTNASISGDKTDPNLGYYDWWILKLDSIGNIIWQKTIGGDGDDKLYAILQTSDGGYALVGTSSSNISGDKTEARVGSFDYWIVKIYPDVFCTPLTFYADADGDGYGNIDFPILSCDTPTAYVSNNTDCNDLNAAINPSALELCNAIDDNCNTISDDDIPYYNYYTDIDGDGYGNVSADTLSCLLFIPGYISDSTDCNDLNNKIHEPLIYYADADGDYFGDSTNTVTACNTTPPDGYVENDLDCDDTNPFINPFSNEIPDSIDNNCNGEIDEEFMSIQTMNTMEFEIYPNPNDGHFTLVLNNIVQKDIAIEAYTIFGEKIFEENILYTKPIEIYLSEDISQPACIVVHYNSTMYTRIIYFIKK